MPLWMIALFLCSVLTEVKAQVYHKVPELHGDTVIFPITLINAFPFISATVNDIEGKFMFDTGSGASIDLNDNYLSLPNKKSIGNGVVGSGQTYTTNINDTIREVKFKNGITYNNLENIASGNYGFLQKNITPDCIGYIGYNFFKGYLFKLDYNHRKITFYKSSALRDSLKDFLLGEKVLAVMDFETRKLPNHPLIKLKINGINALGAFDTGQYGFLDLTPTANQKLAKDGSIFYSGTDGTGDRLFTLKNITLDGKLKTVLKGLDFFEKENTHIIREALGITEPNVIGIGYRFLSQYKTVWDFKTKKIYVLEY